MENFWIYILAETWGQRNDVLGGHGNVLIFYSTPTYPGHLGDQYTGLSAQSLVPK